MPTRNTYILGVSLSLLISMFDKKAWMKKYREEHKEHIKKLQLIRNQRYYRLNREKVIQKTREYAFSHREQYNQYVYNWKKNNSKIVNIHSKIRKHSKDYPLDNECVFCGRTEKLEHGHLDYEDDGHNYVTVCHQCNMWMERD